MTQIFLPFVLSDKINVSEESESTLVLLDRWFPFLQKFNRKFLQFLRYKGITTEDFQKILHKDHFVTSTKRYLKEFALLNENDYIDGLHKHIENILIVDYNFDRQSVENVFKSIAAMNFTVSSDYFYDKYVIKSKLESFISQLRKSSSLKKLNETLAIWYPVSLNLNSIVIDHFKLNKISVKFIEEISFNQTKFNEFLQNHVYDISRAYKSEVQDGIFDQIKTILTEDFQDFQPIHQAIIDDLKHNNKITSSYRLNLIYDRNLLKKIVKPVLKASVKRVTLEKLNGL